MDFKCTLCTTDIKLPLCCKKGTVHIKNNVVTCDLCGSDQPVPVCCGKPTAYVEA